MNKRDVFLPSVSTLVILGMMVFYSCAHQNRVDDELDVASDEENVVQQAENEVKETSTEVADAASTTTETATNEIDMTQMGMDESVNSAENKVDEVKSESENKTAEVSNEKLDEGDLAMLGMDTDPAASIEESKSELPSSDPLAELDSAATSEKLTEAKEEVVSKPVLSEPVLSKPASAKSVAGGSFRVPKIPAKPIVKNGVSLNRFYFVRKGDTPASVSEMIYGSSSHAADLQKWNASSWSPGHILFYSSPVNPKDTQIGSFYRENGVEAEEYTVGKGDWISKVAFQKLGSPDSWKEIAVINGMSRPDKIEVGQRIAIYPKDLSKFATSEESLASTKPTPVKMAGIAPKPVAPTPQVSQEPKFEQVPPQVAQAPVEQTPPQQIPAEVQNATQPPPANVQAEAPKPVAKAKPSVDSSKLVEQNLPAAVILAGVMILSIAYLAVRRRKMAKQQTEEFDEMPSSKSNRR